jgi:adenylosuccinate lyase
MHERYDDPAITGLWGDTSLLAGWQNVEMMVMKARVECGEMPLGDFEAIAEALTANPPDIAWWKVQEKETKHDFQAFVDERRRHIPGSRQNWFHKGMTTYDAEESAFVRKLIDSTEVLEAALVKLMNALRDLALKYRHTPMMAATHGQYADAQSFGKRVLTWWQDLETSRLELKAAKEGLRFSKISGMCGTYAHISPELEELALRLLGFEPYVGATQILPRVLFRPLASAIGGVSKVVAKIAQDIRLGARSASVLYQEPFTPMQTGSSAHPGKRNTIITEQAGGIDNLITAFELAINLTQTTWEERDIAQSCVERVAWRDLFHAAIRQANVLCKVTSGLVVYPQNMMREIILTNGGYAASVAKEILKDMAEPHGLDAESCYRIVQLAAFNLGYPALDSPIVQSLEDADAALALAQSLPLEPEPRGNIRDIIRQGLLQPCDILAPDEEQIAKWNKSLQFIFSNTENCRQWDEVFTLQYLLRNENYMFRQVFGV